MWNEQDRRPSFRESRPSLLALTLHWQGQRTFSVGSWYPASSIPQNPKKFDPVFPSTYSRRQLQPAVGMLQTGPMPTSRHSERHLPRRTRPNKPTALSFRGSRTAKLASAHHIGPHPFKPPNQPNAEMRRPRRPAVGKPKRDRLRPLAVASALRRTTETKRTHCRIFTRPAKRTRRDFMGEALA